MTADVTDALPRWLAEIDTCLPVTPQFLVTGNTNALHLVPNLEGRTRPVELTEAIWRVLERSGFDSLVVVDPVDRALVHPPVADATWLPSPTAGGYLEDLARVARAVVTAHPRRVALLVLYASRLVTQPTNLSDQERDFFVRMQKLARDAEPSPATPD